MTDVRGIRVGQAEDRAAKTGVTVVLCDGEGGVIGADVRGAAPGTREIALTRSENTVQRANAVLLAGGSAFGLDAASGVMRYLEEKGRGVDVGVARVPIVPAAVLFDLSVGRADVRPDAQMGYAACLAAGEAVSQGAFGAGAGATVGKLIPDTAPAPGGTGTASIRLACGVTVGAIVCVNACGDIYDGDRLLACGHFPDGRPAPCREALYSASLLNPLQAGRNTTIAVIATDAVLTKPDCNRLATCAHDGYARAIQPVHTSMDGDTVFALATGAVKADVSPMLLCAAAADVMARAIVNAVQMGAML